MGNIIDQIGSFAASGLGSAVGSIPSAIANYGFSDMQMNRQVQKSKPEAAKDPI